MSARVIAVGIDPRTQIAQSVGEHSAEEVLQLLQAGLVVVPATEQLCRELLDRHVPFPYALPFGMVVPYRSALANVATTLGLDENAKSHQICSAIVKLQERLGGAA